MQELSESFKRIQAKEESESKANKKARENLFRATLNILPGLGGLADACMAMVDAKREQAIEDTIMLLEKNYGEEKVRELELTSEVKQIQENMILMGQNTIKLKAEILQILELKEYYHSNGLKQLIIADIEINKKTFDNTTDIKADVTEVKALLQNFIAKQDRIGIDKELNQRRDISIETVEPITDEEVIIKMGEQIITKVNELIEKNELEAALKILEGLISASDFNNINDELRINILATKGAVFIRSLDKENAGKIFKELQKFNIGNKRKWNYIFKYGTICSNDQLITEALEELKKLGVSEDELTIKKTSYYLSRGKADDIIALLEDDGVEENG